MPLTLDQLTSSPESSSSSGVSSSRKTSSPTADSAASPSKGVVTLDQLTAPKQETKSKGGFLEALTAKAKADVPAAQEGWAANVHFADSTYKAVKHFLSSGPDLLKNIAVEGIKHPYGNPIDKVITTDIGRPLVTGALSLVETAAAGYGGIANSIISGKDGFVGGKEAVEEKINAFAQKLSTTDMVPESDTEKGFSELLAVIPNGIHAVGETVYQQTGSALVGAGSETLLTLLTLKPDLAAKPLQGLVDVAKKGTDAFRSKEAVTAGFDDLIIKNPAGAEKLAEHVGTVDPRLAKYIRNRIKKFTDASEEELSKVAKDKLETDVKSLEAPPIEDLIRGAANTANKGPIKPIGPAVDKYIDKRIDRFKDASGKDLAQPRKEKLTEAVKSLESPDLGKIVEKLPRKTEQPADTALVTSVHPGWADIGKAISPALEKVVDKRFANGERISMSSHQVLDLMAKNTDHPVFKGLLKKIRSVADEFPVRFERKVRDIHGQQWGGLYNPGTHSARVQKSPEGSGTAYLATHEIVHGVTTRFVEANPDHPIVKELENLLAIAKKRADNMGIPHEKLYGLTDVHELVSESMSNTNFMRFLIDSEKYRSTGEVLKDIMHSLAKVVQRLFGVKDAAEAQLFHNVFYHTDALMQAQKLAREELEAEFKSSDSRGAPIPNEEQISSGIRNTLREVEDAATERGSMFPKALTDNPGLKLAEKKLEEYVKWGQKHVAPEALGKQAQAAGAIIAKAMSEEAQKTSAVYHQSKGRRAFWDRNKDIAKEFIRVFESGGKLKDPSLQTLVDGYRAWNKRIYEQDMKTGFEYEARDNYLSHVFKDGGAVEDYFKTKYGAKWGDPGFIKDRTFQLYDEAIKQGFEPKYDNPEDIMQARQHASDVAQMRVQVFDDLTKNGLAVKIEKTREGGRVTSTPKPTDYNSVFWRSPTGDGYWVHQLAHEVLDNAFNSKSLWNAGGPPGDIFRGAMYLKNALVPVKLAFSAFHPLHVVGIDNAAAMSRSTKGMLAGKVHPAVWLKDIAKAGLLYESLPVVGSHSRLGSRMLALWQGKIAPKSITATDRTALQFMGEGGFIPEMAAQYRTKAVEEFASAWRQGKLVTAGMKAPFAIIEGLSKPVFEQWIPGLKIASYLNDVKMALKTNPSLLEDGMARQLAFRKIAKSVDNRYGEMAYNTLFWNKWVKDLSVASTLSLGWNLGFIREYGGGALDLGRAIKDKGGISDKVARGELDRPAFVLAYTTTALAYGGLITYLMTGKPPATLKDYVYPQTGETDTNGKPKRVSTMFYTREFGSIFYHTKEEGVATGLTKTIESKASPLFEMVGAWASNVDYFGHEISDPNAPAYKRLEQKVAYTLSDMEPLSVAGASGGTTKEKILAVAGFTTAPKYVTNTGVEADVSSTFMKYFKQPQTPFEKAEMSADRKKLKKYFEDGSDKYDTLLDAMEVKYQLTAKELKKLEVGISKNENPSIKMFSRLSWTQQKKILDDNWDSMTEDERDEYVSHSNKDHLRGKYDPPETSK